MSNNSERITHSCDQKMEAQHTREQLEIDDGALKEIASNA
jgi:hypothetical protein